MLSDHSRVMLHVLVEYQMRFGFFNHDARILSDGLED